MSIIKWIGKVELAALLAICSIDYSSAQGYDTDACPINIPEAFSTPRELFSPLISSFDFGFCEILQNLGY